MIFKTDGSISDKKSLSFIKWRLGQQAVGSLESRLLVSTLKEITQLAIAPNVVSRSCNILEQIFLRETSLTESKIPLSQVGERSSEWEFFQRRKEALPNDPKAYISKHREVGNLILQKMSVPICSLNSSDNVYHIFMRYKSASSTRRKMLSKGLRSWEVGDYIGFAICPPSFHDMGQLVNHIDYEYSNDILYKQNGFADRLVFRRVLAGFPGRRVFYIIRFDDLICFEVQIMTLRQLIFLHLDHSRYIGKSHTHSELRSLEIFGNNAYLLDLLELIPEAEKNELLQFLCKLHSLQNTKQCQSGD